MGPEGREEGVKGLLMGGLWVSHVECQGQAGAVGHMSMKPVYSCVDTDIHLYPLHIPQPGESSVNAEYWIPWEEQNRRRD